MLGIAIFTAFNLLGMLIKVWIHIPLPANVMGLILFTTALFLKIIPLHWVEAPSQFLLKNLMFFFAPVIVGTMVYFQYIGQHWISMMLSLIMSSFVVLFVTAWVTQLLSKKERQDEHA